MNKPATAPDGRETILSRIREASRASGHKPAVEMPANKGLDALPEDYPTRGDRVSGFARRMEELGGSFVLCDNTEDLIEGLSMLASRSGWKSLAAHRTPQISDITAAQKDIMLWCDQKLGKAALASCEAGIVACEALDAQTGAILIAGNEGALEIVATVRTLVVIAAQHQIAGNLYEAFGTLKSAGGGSLPPGLSIVTGGTITEAVENTRVARGHGVRNIIVFLTTD